MAGEGASSGAGVGHQSLVWGQVLHLCDAGLRRRQRHRRRIVEQDVEVDIRRRLRARLRDARNRQRALAEHLSEDGVDRGRVAHCDVAYERGGSDGYRDCHLRRIGGDARDAFGQTVEHGDGGGLGDARALLQHCRRQRGERGGVGRGVQFRVNLRRPAVVDRGSAAEHEDRRDERIHHRDIAAAVTQQAIKTECRHGDGPTFCRSPRV